MTNMKKNGYTIPELLVIIALLGIVTIFGIMKASYAFSEVNNTEEQKQAVKELVEHASVSYAKSKEDWNKDEVVYVFAKEVAQAGFLFEKDEYNSMKVKITFDQEKNTFQAEVVE